MSCQFFTVSINCVSKRPLYLSNVGSCYHFHNVEINFRCSFFFTYRFDALPGLRIVEKWGELIHYSCLSTVLYFYPVFVSVLLVFIKSFCLSICVCVGFTMVTAVLALTVLPTLFYRFFSSETQINRTPPYWTMPKKVFEAIPCHEVTREVVSAFVTVTSFENHWRLNGVFCVVFHRQNNIYTPNSQ